MALHSSIIIILRNMSRTERARMLLSRLTYESKGMFAGPFYQNMRVVDAKEDPHIKSLNLQFRTSHEFRNSLYMLHGGAMASVLDISALLAMKTFLNPEDKQPVPTKLNFDFFKTGNLDEDMALEVSVVKTGKFLNFSQATLRNENGVPIAQASVVAKNIAIKGCNL